LTKSPSRQPVLVAPSSFAAIDVFVCALILALSALPFFLYEKSPEFLNADVYYVDLAHSLIDNHSYSANFAPERLRPPGLPIILALICATLGCTHDILTRSMPVFLALGLLVSYEVLRRQGGRLVASSSCLLLAASPSIFPWVTSRLWPIFPYFLVTMFVFLLIPKLEASESDFSTLLVTFLLSLLMAGAVIIESAGVALIVALLAWLGLSFFTEPELARLRLKRCLPIALAGLLALGFWLMQGGNTSDWPLPGYPHGYLAQLAVKDGNHPELGFATPKDVVLRVERNLRESTIFLSDALLHRWVSPFWTSPIISGLALLILCGLASSLWRGNSQLCALYFIFFECVYFLWPWFTGVLRFGMAVLPLACFYLAQGAVALQLWLRQYPRRVGTLLFPLSTVLAIAAIRQSWIPGSGHGVQEKMSAIFWVVCIALAVRLIWRGPLVFSGRMTWIHHFFEKSYSVGNLSFGPLQLLAVMAVTFLVTTGVAAEIPMGRENLVSGAAKLQGTPEFQAAQWIKSHTDPKAIIAASQDSLLYHYCGRRVIWFPPISNPKILMDGIRIHHIGYVVVVERSFSYYLPPEAICFGLLHRAYPDVFRLVDSKGQVKIFEVLPDSPTNPANLQN